MKTKSYLVSIAILFLVGLLIGFIGLIFDPFLIPFQDWDQMPAEIQNSYKQKHFFFVIIQYTGLAGIGLSLIGAICYPIIKKRLAR